MDHFGIGSAMQGMVNLYFQSARQTGRTTSLVESVKDGDRIVFSNEREAERVKRLCSDRGVNIECVVCDPHRLFEKPTSPGRTLFDHSVVEDMYRNAITEVQKAIDVLERQSSGYGEAHRETKRRAQEMSKWQMSCLNRLLLLKDDDADQS